MIMCFSIFMRKVRVLLIFVCPTLVFLSKNNMYLMLLLITEQIFIYIDSTYVRINIVFKRTSIFQVNV